MTSCYEWYQSEKRDSISPLGLTPGSYIESAKSMANFGGSLIKGVMVCAVIKSLHALVA